MQQLVNAIHPVAGPDAPLFARMTAGLVIAAALAWISVWASYPGGSVVDETAFESAVAATE